MSKYGDEYKCTCEMEYVSCKNSYHAEMCELWQEETFKSGLDEWDGDLGCLVLAQSPWQHPEDFIWDGDEPVVRKGSYSAAPKQTYNISVGSDAALMQEAVEQWERMQDPIDGSFLSEAEQEVMDALTAGTASPDDTGLICLADGSYADFELRVTYRRGEKDGRPDWQEIWWDGKAPEDWDTNDTPPTATVTYDCDCTPAKKFYCSTHNVQRDKEGDPWRYWGGHSTTGTTYTSSYSYSGFGRCNHCFDTFELPGLQHNNIKISGKRFHTTDTTPDFGLYAYSGWNPSCVATFIPWQDYGLPTVDFARVFEAIQTAWDLSCEGKVVEVGCMGGHGRTGTILACLALLSDPEMTARQAIHHVRKVHCNEAIETNEQEWFVAWFRAQLLGETCPPKPTKYVSKHDATWKAATGAAQAVKQGGATLVPFGKASPDAGPPIKTTSSWCDECNRYVWYSHNLACSKHIDPRAVTVPQFDPETVAGETANARRRNAKRANRRAAKKAQRRAAQVDILQEYV